MIEMMLLDLSKGLWKAVADYLSHFSVAEVVFIVAFAIFALVTMLVFVDWGMNPRKYESRK